MGTHFKILYEMGANFKNLNPNSNFQKIHKSSFCYLVYFLWTTKMKSFDLKFEPKNNLMPVISVQIFSF